MRRVLINVNTEHGSCDFACANHQKRSFLRQKWKSHPTLKSSSDHNDIAAAARSSSTLVVSAVCVKAAFP